MNNKSIRVSDNLTKAGMISTMGATLYSGVARGKLARMIHPWAGVAMVVFSYWHHRIKTRKRQTARK